MHTVHLPLPLPIAATCDTLSLVRDPVLVAERSLPDLQRPRAPTPWARHSLETSMCVQLRLDPLCVGLEC